MIDVTAGIIEKESGSRKTFLICQRAHDDECAFQWEFPGGKMIDGETPEECLIRELKEELDVDVGIKSLFMTDTYRYLDREVFFYVFKARITGGRLKKKVHEDMKWVSADELDKYDFMLPDRKFVKKLKEEGISKKTID